MLCLSEGELHGIVFKGPTGFASRCPVTGDFRAGPNKGPGARGLCQGVRCGGVGVHRFWGSISSGSQDLLLEAVLQGLSQPKAVTTTATMGVHFYRFFHICITAVSRCWPLGVGQGNLCC